MTAATTSRFMVCTSCLRERYGGEEKTCAHGWDMAAGKPREGTCSRCGVPAKRLYCPGGPERDPPVVTFTAGAPVYVTVGEDGRLYLHVGGGGEY